MEPLLNLKTDSRTWGQAHWLSATTPVVCSRCVACWDLIVSRPATIIALVTVRQYGVSSIAQSRKSRCPGVSSEVDEQTLGILSSRGRHSADRHFARLSSCLPQCGRAEQEGRIAWATLDVWLGLPVSRPLHSTPYETSRGAVLSACTGAVLFWISLLPLCVPYADAESFPDQLRIPSRSGRSEGLRHWADPVCRIAIARGPLQSMHLATPQSSYETSVGSLQRQCCPLQARNLTNHRCIPADDACKSRTLSDHS